jgi:hypothetical protein
MNCEGEKSGTIFPEHRVVIGKWKFKNIVNEDNKVFN